MCILKWIKIRKLVPTDYTAGGQRRYDLCQLKPYLFRKAQPKNNVTYGYARVSSHDQKDDLERQVKMLELYCSSQGWNYEIISHIAPAKREA